MEAIKFKEGQCVYYTEPVFGERHLTHINKLLENGECIICNPHWNWDEEKGDYDYDIPFWITVKLSEIEHP